MQPHASRGIAHGNPQYQPPRNNQNNIYRNTYANASSSPQPPLPTHSLPPFMTVAVRKTPMPPGGSQYEDPAFSRDSWKPVFSMVPPMVTLPPDEEVFVPKAIGHSFDFVYDDKMQTHAVYEDTIKRIVYHFLKGNPATLITYGHDSGVSTIEDDLYRSEIWPQHKRIHPMPSPAILPRILNDIFLGLSQVVSKPMVALPKLTLSIWGLSNRNEVIPLLPNADKEGHTMVLNSFEHSLKIIYDTLPIDRHVTDISAILVSFTLIYSVKEYQKTAVKEIPLHRLSSSFQLLYLRQACGKQETNNAFKILENMYDIIEGKTPPLERPVTTMYPSYDQFCQYIWSNLENYSANTLLLCCKLHEDTKRSLLALCRLGSHARQSALKRPPPSFPNILESQDPLLIKKEWIKAQIQLSIAGSDSSGNKLMWVNYIHSLESVMTHLQEAGEIPGSEKFSRASTPPQFLQHQVQTRSSALPLQRLRQEAAMESTLNQQRPMTGLNMAQPTPHSRESSVSSSIFRGENTQLQSRNQVPPSHYRNSVQEATAIMANREVMEPKKNQLTYSSQYNEDQEEYLKPVQLSPIGIAFPEESSLDQGSQFNEPLPLEKKEGKMTMDELKKPKRQSLWANSTLVAEPTILASLKEKSLETAAQEPESPLPKAITPRASYLFEDKQNLKSTYSPGTDQNQHSEKTAEKVGSFSQLQDIVVLHKGEDRGNAQLKALEEENEKLLGKMVTLKSKLDESEEKERRLYQQQILIQSELSTQLSEIKRDKQNLEDQLQKLKIEHEDTKKALRNSQDVVEYLQTQLNTREDELRVTQNEFDKWKQNNTPKGDSKEFSSWRIVSEYYQSQVSDLKLKLQRKGETSKGQERFSISGREGEEVELLEKENQLLIRRLCDQAVEFDRKYKEQKSLAESIPKVPPKTYDTNLRKQLSSLQEQHILLQKEYEEQDKFMQEQEQLYTLLYQERDQLLAKLHSLSVSSGYDKVRWRGYVSYLVASLPPSSTKSKISVILEELQSTYDQQFSGWSQDLSGWLSELKQPETQNELTQLIHYCLMQLFKKFCHQHNHTSLDSG